MAKNYQNSGRSGELPAFDDLSQPAVARFMQNYFALQVRDARLGQALLDDEQAMGIVREAYEGAQQGTPTRAEQKGFSDRLEARVRKLAEAGQRSGGTDSYHNRY